MSDREEGAFQENVLPPEAKPRVTGHFSSTPPPPLNPSSQIVSLTPEGLVIICFILSP